jgi:hypothetical protein
MNDGDMEPVKTKTAREYVKEMFSYACNERVKNATAVG